LKLKNPLEGPIRNGYPQGIVKVWKDLYEKRIADGIYMSDII